MISKLGSFYKNVLKLISGTTLAQLIPVLVSPILTRIYSPQDFGLFALFITISAILNVLSTLRYDNVLILPRDNIDGRRVLILSICVTSFVALIILLTSYLFGDYLLISFGYEELMPFKIILAFGVLAAGLYQISDFWLNRKKDYFKMGVLRVIQSVTIAILNIGLGLYLIDASGLIYGNVFGFIIASVLGLILLKGDLVKAINEFSFKDTLKIATQYKDFAVFGTPATLLNVFAQQSFFLFIGYSYGLIALGYFYLLNRIIGLPTTIIGSSLGQVFYQRISQVPINESFPKVRDFALQVILQSFFIHILSYFLVDSLLVAIFGDQWSDSLEFLPFFVILLFISFIFGPISMLFNYFQLQKQNLIWQILWVVTNIILFFVSITFNFSITTFLTIFLIKQYLLYIGGIIFLVFYSLKKKSI